MVNGYINVPKSFSSYISAAVASPDNTVTILPNTADYYEYEAFLLSALSKVPVANFDFAGQTGLIIGHSNVSDNKYNVSFDLGPGTVVISNFTESIVISLQQKV